jgi:hypothetical protein
MAPVSADITNTTFDLIMWYWTPGHGEIARNNCNYFDTIDYEPYDYGWMFSMVLRVLFQ